MTTDGEVMLLMCNYERSPFFPGTQQTPQMPKFYSRCQVNSSNTKASEHLGNLAKRMSVKPVARVAHVAESPYLGSIDVAVLHHGENATEKPLEKGDTILQLLELFIIMAEALFVGGIGVAQAFSCEI